MRERINAHTISFSGKKPILFSCFTEKNCGKQTMCAECFSLQKALLKINPCRKKKWCPSFDDFSFSKHQIPDNKLSF